MEREKNSNDKSGKTVKLSKAKMSRCRGSTERMEESQVNGHVLVAPMDFAIKNLILTRI